MSITTNEIKKVNLTIVSSYSRLTAHLQNLFEYPAFYKLLFSALDPGFFDVSLNFVSVPDRYFPEIISVIDVKLKELRDRYNEDFC